jgi:dTDP-glucose 4,6-dehydratase
MRIFVTGGAGFIGSALIRHLIENTDHEVLNFDKLTYAGTLSTVERVAQSNRYRFVQGDICDADAVKAAIADFKPEIVTHLAAESHVDRSIDGPGAFVETNVIGTFTMRDACLLALPRRPGKGCVPLPSHLDRRGVRVAR